MSIKLRKEIAAPDKKSKPVTVKPQLTPEQKEKIKQDGLKRLAELRRISAEKMRKEAEKNKK